MKDIFELRIVGDSDVLVNGEVFEAETLFFRSLDREKMIEVLDRFHVEPKTSESWDKQTAGFFRKSIKDMRNFLAAQAPIHLFQEFGGNQFVKVKRITIPTEEDFVD